MTNNRMFLVCKTDGEVFCIGKYLVASSWKLPSKEFIKNYEKYLEEHTHAYDQFGQDFELMYETDPPMNQNPQEYEEIYYHRSVGVVQNKK